MPQSREYREARERAHIMGQEFLEKLDADHYEFYQNFVIGFRLATQIMMTIFIGK